jgi:uncharacterized UBP type Zn finger protein
VRKPEQLSIESPCAHAKSVKIHEVRRPAEGCQDCLAMGGQWVHLRVCLICGKVGCCDSSPNHHATSHFHSTGHAIMTSAEPGETWVCASLTKRQSHHDVRPA